MLLDETDDKLLALRTQFVVEKNVISCMFYRKILKIAIIWYRVEARRCDHYG